MAKSPAAVPSGPFLRQRGLPSASLPPASATPAELVPFVRAILREAVPLVDSIVPSSSSNSSTATASADATLPNRKPPWKSKGCKSFSALADGARQVEILVRKVSGAELNHLAGRPLSRSNNSGRGKNHRAGEAANAAGVATAGSSANQQQQLPPKSPPPPSLSGSSSSGRLRRTSSAEHSAMSAATSSATAATSKKERGENDPVGAPPDVAGANAVPTTGATTTVTTKAVPATRHNTINWLSTLSSSGTTQIPAKDAQGGSRGDVNNEAGANPQGLLDDASAMESWFCRLSTHPDAARAGTASWAEFRRGFREEHQQTEKAFTKSIVSAEMARRWRLGGGDNDEAPVVVDVAVPCMGSGGGGDEAAVKKVTYGCISMELIEMRHKVGRPVLRDRVFPIVQLIASVMAQDNGDQQEGDQAEEEDLAGGKSSSRRAKGKAREEKEGAPPRYTETAEFLVVSIPVLDACTAHDKVVVGSYASVERIRKLPGSNSSSEEENGGPIEWLMAVTSDARGSLPTVLQEAALPRKIAQDVPLFIGWAGKQRGATANKAQAMNTDVKTNNNSNMGKEQGQQKQPEKQTHDANGAKGKGPMIMQEEASGV